MSQNPSKKLTPNLDRQSTKVLNLTVLRRMDPFIDEILFTAAHVSLYDFNIENNQWSRKNVEGSLFVVKRDAQVKPQFQFIVMNRRNTENLKENLLDFEYELKIPYLLYRNAKQEVNGIWFYNSDECEEVGNLFNRIVDEYPKARPSSIMPSSKSEFEELEPVSIRTESPRESSSTAASANTPEDTVFTNSLSTPKVIGNYASSVESFGRPYNSVTATSTVPTGFFSPAPSAQMPSTSLETINIGNQVTKLVNPSTFLAPTPTSSLIIPPISSSVPPNAAVHRPLILPHQYGTPILQHFPPPNPHQSLTPIPSPTPNRPVISRDKVRDALLSLVQDDQFIDMMFQTMLKLNHS